MRKKREEEIDWEAYESEARKRSAWGHYTATMGYIRAVEKEENYKRDLKNAKNEEEKQKIIKKKKDDDNRPQMLIIS